MVELKIKKDDEEITLVDKKDIENSLDGKVDNSDLNNYYTKSQSNTEYSITVEKQSTADSGFFSTYVIKQNNVQKGVKINVPKDFLVKSATVKACTTANSPVSGYEVGDKYIDLVINSKDSTDTDEHLYLATKEIGAYPVDEITLTVDNGKLAIKDNGITWAKLSTTVRGIINGKEDINNKVNSVSANSTITQYPSAKCVYDTFCQKNDPRLSDARTPTSHTHGSITDAGAIGSTANLPIITTTSGKLTTGSFGKNANTFAEGNHEHAFGALASGNIDEITDDNVYGIPKVKISDGSITGTLPPTTKTGGVRSFLLETRKYDENNSIQFAYTLTTTEDYNRIFYRIRTGNQWYTWTELIDIKTLEDELNNKANATHTHMLDDISITSALGANSDLNDLTNVGIYTCTATNSGTLANRPPFSGNYAMLIENKSYNANTIIQSIYVLIGASPLSFYRYLSSNGTWSSWTYMGGCSFTLPANSDLNDLKEFTIYACNTTNSKTLANKPFTGQIPCIIKNMPYNNVNYFIQFVYPLIDDNDLNDIYYRLYWNGAWLDWKKIITDVDINDLNNEIDTKLSNKANKTHTHFLGDIDVTSALTANDDLNNYTDAGIYTCSKTNSGTLANKPFTGSYSCIIENKKFSSGYVIQFVYKITTSATTFCDTYFRCHNGTTNGWTTDWVRIYTDKDFVVSNSLTDTSTKNALSAKQGKVLNDRLDAMQTVETGTITGFNSAYGASGQVNYIKYNGWVVVNYYNLKMTSKPSSYPPLFTLSYKALKGIGNYLFYTKDNDGGFYPTSNIQSNVAYSGVLMYPTSD